MSRKFSKTAALGVASSGGLTKISSDPKRNQTVLHLSTLGAIRGEQNNTFVDDSPNRYTITRTGNVAPSTFTPFGDSWSNYFDGSGDYLSVADNAALELGSGDFTIESWIYLNSAPAKATSVNEWSSCICAKDSNTLTRGFEFRTYGNATTHTGLSFFNFYDNVNSQLVAANFDFQLNTWYHVAVSKSGTSARLFINGILSATSTFSQSQQDSTAPLYIGWAGYAGYDFYFPGYISNLRIVKGTALYTSDFTPSKSPLTAVSGTSLLTCASNRFQDKSSNNFTITPAGNVAVKTASPFPQAREFKKPQRGWCVPFNGSTQRLETPAASVANGLQLGTSDFTIECWVKAKPQSNYARLIDSCAYGNPNYGFLIASPASGATSNLAFATYTGITVDYIELSLPNVLNNTWNHIAVVRNSNTLYGYVNGELVSTASLPVANRNLNFTTPIVMGAARSASAATYSNWFSGKISNVMIVKKALYSSNFVPMQSPRTADQNGTLPVLLTCQGGSIIDYSYYSQTLTSAGSLVVDSDGPFDQDDELSYYFDGNGDYLSIADNAALELGSGDFTIEAWINPQAYGTIDGNSGYESMICFKDLSYYFVITGTASSFTNLGFGWYSGGVWNGAGASYNFSLNRWYHVSVSRQGSSLRFFVNGSLISTQSYSFTANNSASAFLVGSQNVVNYYRYFNGYISNLRLVVGTALYTSSFTPSRKPLPAVSGTSLLTCRGRTAADDSTNALTVTVYGTAGATANPISRKSPFRDDERYGMSYYFDGSSDKLNINHTGAVITPLQLGAGDFTIETWVYPNTLSGQQDLIDFRTTGPQTAQMLVFFNPNSTISIYKGSTSYGTGGLIRAYAWTHIAICRSGTTTRTFINGELISSFSDTTTYTVASNRPIIGGHGITSSQCMTGYISGFSIQKGVAKYTAAFTPPTSPQLTGDFSQSLLLNAYPAIYDTTRKNAIETVGSYAAANIGPPFATRAERYAVYFGGSTANDYLTIPYSPDFDFGTGDFTIETWVYIAGNSLADGSGNRYAHIIGNYNNAGQGWYFSVWGNGTTTGTGAGIEVQNSGVYVSNGRSFTIAQSTWTHLTVTRKDGTMRIFMNGIQQGTDIAFAYNMSGSRCTIGLLDATSYNRYLFGGLYDLRVTKGFARYTSNFTTPALPLPIK